MILKSTLNARCVLSKIVDKGCEITIFDGGPVWSSSPECRICD